MDIASTKLRNDEGSKLDVAVLKATLNDEVVPKEKHVVTLKIACGSGHQSVHYVIHRCAHAQHGGALGCCDRCDPSVHACITPQPRAACTHARAACTAMPALSCTASSHINVLHSHAGPPASPASPSCLAPPPVTHSLVQRLEAHKGKWLVTLKTLVVFHRLLRETNASFQARRADGVNGRERRSGPTGSMGAKGGGARRGNRRE